jgi:hypothetical protein
MPGSGPALADVSLRIANQAAAGAGERSLVLRDASGPQATELITLPPASRVHTGVHRKGRSRRGTPADHVNLPPVPSRASARCAASRSRSHFYSLHTSPSEATPIREAKALARFLETNRKPKLAKVL